MTHKSDKGIGDTTKAKSNFVSSFVTGARNGFNMSMMNMAPNVLFAFALIQILNLSVLSTVIGNICGPIMAVFGLPGIAATAVVAGLLSTGGGMGAAASLALNGDIGGNHVAILLVGITVFGSFLQYMGRVLGTADIDSKHYPVLLIVNILCGFLAMLVTSFIVGR